MKKKFTALCSVMIALSVCVTVFGVNNTQKTDITTAQAKLYYAEKTETTTRGSLGDLVSGVVGGLGEGASNLSSSLSGITSGSLGDITLGESLGNIDPSSFSGIGDALGGIGDSFGNIGSGLGDIFGGFLGGETTSATATTVAAPTTAPPAKTTASADIGLIIPVPAATQTTAQATENKFSENKIPENITSENKIPDNIFTQASPVTEESKSAGETVDYAAKSNPYKKPTGTYSAGDEDEGIKWLQWIFIYTHYGLKDDGITGVLDEDTVAVVKKLQHENGLTVDGKVTADVIKAAEVLYYRSALGENASAIEVSSQVTTGEGASEGTVVIGSGKEIPVALIVVVLVIIWVIAIGGIVLLFIFKKKKISAKNAEKRQTEGTEEKAEDSKTENKETFSSIADLFEEAERKGK